MHKKITAWMPGWINEYLLPNANASPEIREPTGLGSEILILMPTPVQGSKNLQEPSGQGQLHTEWAIQEYFGP